MLTRINFPPIEWGDIKTFRTINQILGPKFNG
jgi:hypothetical protein